MSHLIEESLKQQFQGPTSELLICTPTRDGRVTFKWHRSSKELLSPLKSMEIGESGQPIDASRNIGCAKALQLHCRYILFWDADVLVPPDTLQKLLSIRMPIVGALYRSRGPPFPLLANKDDHPIPDDVLQTNNALVEVDEIGMGFTLVDMRAIKRYAAKLDDWQCYAKHDQAGGVASYDDKTAVKLNYSCQYCQNLLNCKFFDYRAGKAKTLAISEDYYFCRKIKELCGFKIYAFTGARAIHENSFGEVHCEKPELITSLQSAANVR